MMRSRKLGLAVVTAAMVSLVAAGCSASTTPAKTAPVTLTFWGAYGNGGNSTQQDALNKTLIPAFEKANPGITVKYTDIAYSSLLQKLTTSAAGGQLPDLVRSDRLHRRTARRVGCRALSQWRADRFLAKRERRALPFRECRPPLWRQSFRNYPVWPARPDPAS